MKKIFDEKILPRTPAAVALFIVGLLALLVLHINPLLQGQNVFSRFDDEDEFDDDDTLPSRDDDGELISKRQARQMAQKPRKEAKNLRTRLKSTQESFDAYKGESEKKHGELEEKAAKAATLAEEERKELNELREYRTGNTITKEFNSALKDEKLKPTDENAVLRLLKSRMKDGESKIEMKNGEIVGMDKEVKELAKEFPGMFNDHRGGDYADAGEGGGKRPEGSKDGNQEMNSIIRRGRQRG